MGIQAALRLKIKGIAAVSASLTEVYTMPVKEGAVHPYGTIQRISGNRNTSLGGLTGQAREMWQVDVWAEADGVAETVMQAIIAAIGAVDHVTWTGVFIHLCVIDDNRDLVQDPESFISRKSADFAIVYDV